MIEAMATAPVTGLTGYPGAGKAALPDRLLTEPHGKKHAVIVNAFVVCCHSLHGRLHPRITTFEICEACG